MDEQISEMKLIGENQERRLDAETPGKQDIILNDKIERSVPDLRCDDGQNFPALIDQIAGMVKDVQNTWVV